MNKILPEIRNEDIDSNGYDDMKKLNTIYMLH